MSEEMVHELIVDDCVIDFGNDWENGDGAVVFWKCFLFFFVDGSYACVCENGWVFSLSDAVVELGGDDWCEDFIVMFDDEWGDAVDVGGFSCVKVLEGVVDLCF